MKQKNKLQSIRKEGRNTLIAIAVIGVAVYLGFIPLFEKIEGGMGGGKETAKVDDAETVE